MQNRYLDKYVNFPLEIPSLKRLVWLWQWSNNLAFSEGFLVLDRNNQFDSKK